MAFAQVTIIGNVGKAPEMSYTDEGLAVTRFSLAVNKKGRDGKESTNWYNCVAFRAAAETISQHVQAGSQLFVQGDLSPRMYTARDGKPGLSLDVTVEKFSFIGSGKKSTGELEAVPF